MCAKKHFHSRGFSPTCCHIIQDPNRCSVINYISTIIQIVHVVSAVLASIPKYQLQNQVLKEIFTSTDTQNLKALMNFTVFSRILFFQLYPYVVKEFNSISKQQTLSSCLPCQFTWLLMPVLHSCVALSHPSGGCCRMCTYTHRHRHTLKETLIDKHINK